MTWPNWPELVMLPTGLMKFVWLKMLKNSTRSRSDTLSVIWVDFAGAEVRSGNSGAAKKAYAVDPVILLREE